MGIKASRRWHEPVCIVKRLEGVPPPPPAPAGCRAEEPAPGEAMPREAMPGKAMPGELEFPQRAAHRGIHIEFQELPGRPADVMELDDEHGAHRGAGGQSRATQPARDALLLLDVFLSSSSFARTFENPTESLGTPETLSDYCPYQGPAAACITFGPVFLSVFFSLKESDFSPHELEHSWAVSWALYHQV